ncbi:hypothetical protein HDF22_001060 [Mucilaginibacter lappiensis]|uniref:Uncharacterized protein n=1 Tax=Mucilaginibacter lappiensis TaxID=354630 RepID=A0A841J8B1_9SPHI|nr:hypothetical protein [Mucilaginibacter lappiensis]
MLIQLTVYIEIFARYDHFKLYETIFICNKKMTNRFAKIIAKIIFRTVFHVNAGQPWAISK